MATSDLRIAGLVPLSTVDKPGDLTATVFTQGCPWRCPYCHNPHLLDVDASTAAAIDRWTWTRVLAFLETRRGLLDGVAFSGGEPTLQRGLPAALRDVAAAGFHAYLHTAGPAPAALERALPHLDWVGFDVKAPFEAYERTTMTPGSGAHARSSLRLLMASGVPFEVRTTVHAALLGAADLERMADDLTAEGVRAWVLQEYRDRGARPGLGPSTFPHERLAGLRERFGSVSLR